MDPLKVAPGLWSAAFLRSAIPKTIRDALNLSEGTRLTLDVRGQQIVLSKEPAWRKLQGAAADRDWMSAFAAFKRHEREREDSRP